MSGRLVPVQVGTVVWYPFELKTSDKQNAGWTATCPHCKSFASVRVWAAAWRPMAVQCEECKKWVMTP